MKKIEFQHFSEERSLYNTKDILISKCMFESEIGESPLKESNNIEIIDSTFKIRYPIWHTKDVSIKKSNFEISSRAPFWYCKNLNIHESVVLSPKALRESFDILISKSKITSSEFGWKSSRINIIDSEVSGEYAFLESEDIDLENVVFGGKYSFQYVKGATIKNSVLNTKDAFWHSENITVINSVINGEYLGWYSKNLHLINCVIKGTQPLCYCENLILTNCIMEECDLAFEYSSLNAEIINEIISIKNPLKGSIKAKGIKEIIFDENRRDSNDVTIEIIKE